MAAYENNDNQNQSRKNNKYNKNSKPMTKKQVEEVACWVLRDKERWPFNDKVRLMTNELRGKASSKLIREVVEAYKW